MAPIEIVKYTIDPGIDPQWWAFLDHNKFFILSMLTIFGIIFKGTVIGAKIQQIKEALKNRFSGGGK